MVCVLGLSMDLRVFKVTDIVLLASYSSFLLFWSMSYKSHCTALDNT